MMAIGFAMGFIAGSAAMLMVIGFCAWDESDE